MRLPATILRIQYFNWVPKEDIHLLLIIGEMCTTHGHSNHLFDPPRLQWGVYYRTVKHPVTKKVTVQTLRTTLRNRHLKHAVKALRSSDIMKIPKPKLKLKNKKVCHTETEINMEINPNVPELHYGALKDPVSPFVEAWGFAAHLSCLPLSQYTPC